MRTIYYNIHIPRAGGTTLNYILWTIFKTGLLRVYEKEEIKEKGQLPGFLTTNTEIKCVSGHKLSYPAPEAQECEFKYVTFVRHPWKRCLSLYAYEKKNGFPHPLPPDMPFDDWLAMKHRKDFDFTNYQSSKILGIEDPEVEFDTVKKALDKFYFIGITERYDESLILLKHKLNLEYKDVAFQIKNTTGFGRNREKNASISNEFLKRNKTDFLMYEYANMLMDKEIEDLNLNMEVELIEFETALREFLSGQIDELETFGKNKKLEAERYKASLALSQEDNKKLLETIKEIQYFSKEIELQNAEIKLQNEEMQRQYEQALESVAEKSEIIEKLQKNIAYIRANSGLSNKTKKVLRWIFKKGFKRSERNHGCIDIKPGKTKKITKTTPTREKCVLSIVIGSYNRKSFLQKTIESIAGQKISVPHEIIVVDGGSNDGSAEWLLTQKNIITIVQHNRGEWNGKPVERRSWGYFMNLAFKSAEGKYILMISDDCLFLPGAVNAGLNEFQKGEAAGTKLGGVAFYFRNWPADTQYYVQKTLGGKLMVNHGLFSREVLEEIGWVDEHRYLFYKADGDLCLRIWEAGYSIIACPGAVVEHFYDENENVRLSNNAVLKNDQKAYIDRWSGIFYFKDKPDERGRILSDFEDSGRTAEKIWNERK